MFLKGFNKPKECVGFGAMDVTKPYACIRFGAMDVTKPCTFIGFGGWGPTWAAKKSPAQHTDF